ncbi:MAG: hypothetical protein U0350_09240 [Caldilineaceae bacterium]
MAVYDWTHLLQRWANGQIDTEQMIGQLLQWGQKTAEQAARCEQKQVMLEQQIAALAARVAALEDKRTLPKV